MLGTSLAGLTRLRPVNTQEALGFFVMGNKQPRYREYLTSCVSQEATTQLIELGQGNESGPSLAVSTSHHEKAKCETSKRFLSPFRLSGFRGEGRFR
jgi:hypothetical protein